MVLQLRSRLARGISHVPSSGVNYQSASLQVVWSPVLSGEAPMSKGMDQKREQKRKPAKTLEEKRAAKKAKKAERQGRLM